MLQGESPTHTATVHQKEAKSYLIRYAIEQKKSKTSKIMEPPKPLPEDHNYFQAVDNRLGKKATLGITSKYYCGG